MPENHTTQNRKADHLRIVANENVAHKTKTTLLEDVELVYQTLPGLNKKDIRLKTQFLGHSFSAPLMVSGLTGGTPEAQRVNQDIARAVQATGLGMGIGSQRAMLENPSLAKTYSVRDVAPNIFVAGNMGVAQLEEYPIQQIEGMLDNIGANALAVHLNAAQESVQPEGDTDLKESVSLLKRVSRQLSKPVYVKEVGHGISFEVARQLDKTGVKALDVQGAGGTSWVGIESHRGNGALGNTFWDIGIPTAASILECKSASAKPILASGGISNGLDAAKGIALGASLAVMARPIFLAQQQDGAMGVQRALEQVMEEFRNAMFLVGAKDVKALQQTPYVLQGNLYAWVEQRKKLWKPNPSMKR